MPEATVLDPDQAEDLRELLDHAESIAQRLPHAADEFPDDLAQTSYLAHFQPRSAGFWLIAILVHTQYWQRRTLRPAPEPTPAPSPPHRPRQPQQPLNTAGLTHQLP
jgi:hypothetical protein